MFDGKTDSNYVRRTWKMKFVLTTIRLPVRGDGEKQHATYDTAIGGETRLLSLDVE